MVIFTISMLVTFCMWSSGCFSDEYVSDWEYEHYYYVEVKSNSTDNYRVCVPLPDASCYQDKERYLDEYIDNLKIEKGSCMYKVIEYNSNKYLQIKGASSISISSSFKLWDANADATIEKEAPHSTLIYSNSSNISLIIDSRFVKKTNEEDYWYLFYSAVINQNTHFPVPTKQSWKGHLTEEYFIQPSLDWCSYSIREEADLVRIHNE